MIDIHTHILPGLDDGARDMDDSLAMAEVALKSGVHTVVATSHANTGGYFREYGPEVYEERLQAFRRALEQEGMPLTVLSGMEIFTTEDVPELIEDGRLIPINHTSFFLMEFAFGIEDFEMDQMLGNVLAMGLTPVIAHPERYACVQESPERVNGWMKKGCLAQINRGSVFGRFGGRAKECADALLEQRWVTCIASDAHKPYERTPYMADIKEYMEERFSYRYSRELLYENPRKILMGSASAENNRSEIVS